MRPALLETAPNQGMQALHDGTLRVEQHGEVACSYLGSYRIVWPEGFELASDGSSITGTDGRPAAYLGKTVLVSGGLSEAPTDSPCAVTGAGTWFVSSVEARGTP